MTATAEYRCPPHMNPDDFAKLSERDRRVQHLAQVYLDREVLANQSALVTELLRSGHDGFEADDIENLLPDPDEWTFEQCEEYLNDHGYDLPADDENPRKMSRESLEITLESVGIDSQPDESDETLQQAVIENMNDGTLEDELVTWREQVRTFAEEQEVFQWWLVTDWLAEKLDEIDEPVIRNNYGHWWGRTCCGQGVLMDGTLQQVADKYAD